MGRVSARPAGQRPRDLTVVAVPFYFAAMALEHWWLRRRARRLGPSAGDYERRDTIASLSMGVGSLVAPLLVPRLLRPLTRGRVGKAVLGIVVGAVVVTTAADAVARATGREDAGRRGVDADGTGAPPVGVTGPVPSGGTGPGDETDRLDARRSAVTRVARSLSAAGGVTAVVAGGVLVTSTWAARTAPSRLWRRRLLPSLGHGPLAMALAVAGWDFIYYWNHRFMHESRYMWAIHVVHHSSERYNLSTALRQPVADALGTSIPYGALCLVGIGPDLVATARGVNLLYQFWIHTETIARLGPAESAFNTPSHHRVHHGSNRQYLDRNHGSILIVWDRLFGTFEPEDERVVYGLTKNIDTFNVVRIATHEYVEMLRDVAASTTWRDRLSFVVRGPGWAGQRRAELTAPLVPTVIAPSGSSSAGGPGEQARSVES